MAAKSAQSKGIKSKKINDEDNIVNTEEEESIPATKIKSPIIVEEVEEEAPVIPLEDKADPLAVEVDSDEFAGDEMGLDEEIDPFGDKWES